MPALTPLLQDASPRSAIGSGGSVLTINPKNAAPLEVLVKGLR